MQGTSAGRADWETETAELRLQIQNFTVQLQNQRGETINATHQLALQEQWLLAKDHQLELLKALLAPSSAEDISDPDQIPLAPTEIDAAEIEIDIP